MEGGGSILASHSTAPGSILGIFQILLLEQWSMLLKIIEAANFKDQLNDQAVVFIKSNNYYKKLLSKGIP